MTDALATGLKAEPPRADDRLFAITSVPFREAIRQIPGIRSRFRLRCRPRSGSATMTSRKIPRWCSGWQWAAARD